MLMINGLACLLIITSLCVIMVRTAKKAALFYSLQSLVLVLLFVYLANEMQAHELYMWSISAFITKVVLVPAILIYAMKKVDEKSNSSWNKCRLVDPDHSSDSDIVLLCCCPNRFTVGCTS